MVDIRKRSPEIIACLVVLLLIALTCRATYIPDPVQQTIVDEATGEVTVVEQLSVAQQYCEYNWDSLMLPTIEEQAVDIGELIPLVRADLTSAGAQYAKRENDSSPYSFCVKGTVNVLQLEDPDRASRTKLVVDVQPYDGNADAKIQISSVIRTNAIRDAVGFLRLDDFANQVEFAELTAAFNDRIKADVIANLTPASLIGTDIDILGCVSLTQYIEPNDCLIVPVQITPKEGE